MDFVKVISWHVNKYIPVNVVIVRHKTAKLIAPLVKTLLDKCNRLMRNGKVDEHANALAENFGRLVSRRT